MGCGVGWGSLWGNAIGQYRGGESALAISVAEHMPHAGETVGQTALHGLRAGLASLEFDRPPCPGYRASEWSRTLARASAFLDEFGEQAGALGWTASRLFGVHPVAGLVRVDACGALALPGGGPVRAITATEVNFELLTFRVLPGQPKGVPLWLFNRRAA